MNVRVKSLLNYIFPAVGGLFVAYLYNVVDGIFVGRGVGQEALGAVNIGVPFITFVVAIASMLPMGGATIVAINMGRDEKNKANDAFMTSIFLTLIISLVLMFIGMFFSKQIVDISGGTKLSEEMRKMAIDYLFYYSAFSIPMLMSNCLSVFIRNDGSPTLSFIGMCVGAIANIFLDWLFVFPLNWGIIGAAVASGMGQVFSIIVLLTHFIFKKGNLRIRTFSIKGTLALEICKRGLPEAVTQLTTPVTALCYNLMLASLIGDIGVSTFSVLSFIFSLSNAILSGVAQGLQPLWGNSYGKNDKEELHYLSRYGMIINGVLSMIIFIGLLLFKEESIRIFNSDSELVIFASSALPVFSASFIPMSFNLIYTSLLYSTQRTKQSNIIAICRGIVIKIIGILALPFIFGNNAIWSAPLIAETLTLLIAIYITKKPSLIH